MAILNYDISVTGLQAVERAFASIEGRIARLNRLTGAGPVSGGRTPRQRTDDVLSTHKQAITAAEAERAANKKRAAEAKEAASAIKQAEKAIASAKATTAKVARDLERQEAAASRNRIRRAKEEESAAQKAAQAEAARLRKQEAAAKRSATIQARQARSAAFAAARVGRSRYDRLAGIAGNTWGTVRNVGMMGMTTAGLGAGALFATATHATIEKIAAASKLANQFSDNGSSLSDITRTKRELLREADAVPGFTGVETLGAISKYHEKTGEAGSARRMVKQMGGLSLATGSSLEDVSEFGSIIHNVLKTKGINGPQAEGITMDLLRNASAVAKEKSIELRDFARVGGSVIAQAPLLTGDVGGNAKLGMAITQMAIAGGAASPEEAATSYQNMIGDMVKHQKQLKKMGIKDSIQNGRLDLGGTLGQILEKTGGDIDKAMKVFNIRGLRAFNGLGVMYKTAEEQQKGSGRAAVMGELQRLSGLTVTDRAIQAGVASRMSDPDMQMKEALKRFHSAIGQELVPVITQLVPKVAELAPLFGRLASGLAAVAEWLLKNPLTGVTSMITAMVVKDIAAAAIGDAIKRTLIGALSVPPGGAPGGGRPGAPSAPGAPGATPGKAPGAPGTSLGGVVTAVGAGVTVGVPLAASLYEGGTNATDEQRKRNLSGNREANNIAGAGGQFDGGPFVIGTGADGKPITVSPDSPGEKARQRASDEMGLKRRGAMLRQIAEERLALDSKDGERSLLGLLELKHWMPGKTPGDPGKWQGGFDLTGRGAREEQRKLLDERERKVLAGEYDKAQPDLEKQGYSTETNDQGRGGPQAMTEAGGKLISAADALNAAADNLARSSANFQGPVR